MSGKMWTLFLGTVFLTCLNSVSGNGRLLVPPQRSSLWRDPLFYRNRYVVKNYDDHTLDCGGFWKMHENDGRCGVCGDAWDDEQPRPNEAGGMYARGIIGRTYSTDKRFIDTVVQVTSSMSGYFEFNICPNDDVKQTVKVECLDQFPLRILSKDRSTSYGRRYSPDIKAGQAGIVELSLEIPEGLECKQCVLRWRWHGANNYGICRNGQWGKGCGEQPEIYNCADIAILPEHVINGGKTIDNRPVRPKSTTTTTTQKTTTTKAATTTTTPAVTTTTEEPLAVMTTTTTQIQTTTTPVVTTTTQEPTTEQQKTTTTESVMTSTQKPVESTTHKVVTTTTEAETSTKEQKTTTITEQTTAAQEQTPTTPIQEQTTATQEQRTTTTTTRMQEQTTASQEQRTTTTPMQEQTTASQEQTTTTLIQEQTPATQEQTTVTTNETSTSNMPDMTSTAAFAMNSTLVVKSTTSQSAISESTSKMSTVQPEPEDSVITESTPQPEPEQRQSTEQFKLSTSGVVDQTTTMAPSDKAVTETWTDLPLVQTDAAKTDQTASSSTPAKTVEQRTTERIDTITTTISPVNQAETQTAEPQTNAVEFQNDTTTSSSVIVTVDSASNVPVAETTAQITETLNTTSSIKENAATNSPVERDTASSIISDMTNLGSSTSIRSSIDEQTTQSIRIDDKATSQLERSATTTPTIVFEDTSDRQHDSSSTHVPLDATTAANGAVKNEMMTVVKSDTTITPIEITMRPLIENTTRTQITVDTTNALSIKGQTDFSSNEQTVKPLVRSTELLPKLQDTTNNLNIEVTASNQLADTSSTAPSVTVAIDTSSTTLSNQSRQPFVTGNIVTSTGTPKASTSSLSLVDLLNAISKLENITSDELIDAILPASNSNNSNITNSSENASATVHEDKTKNTTPSQKMNDNSESTGTTESLQSSKQQTTEANMMTGSTTDLIVNPDMLFNIVTSRTTRISQPQGGRFGGGMSIAKITPVDNIVNIDLNIPGGEANVEKERNKIDGGS